MNGDAVRADAAYVLRAWLRAKSGVVVSVAMPIILLVGLGLLVRPGVAEAPLVHVADLAGTEEARALVAALAASPALRVTATTEAQPDPAAWLASSGGAAYVEIPPEYDGQSPPRVVLESSDAARATIVRDAVEAALAEPRVHPEEVRVPERAGYAAFLLPGVLGLTVLTVGLPVGFTSVAELRHHGLLERLAVSPMTRREWLLARMLGASAIALGVAAVLVLVAWLALGIRPDLTPLTLLLLVAGTLVFSGLGTILGAAVRKPETGSAVLNLVLLPIVLLSGTFFEVARLPAPLQWLSYASPLTHLNAGLRLDMLQGDPTGAALRAAALAGVAVALLLAAGRLVRWTAPE